MADDQWQRHVRLDSHGKELVHHVAELVLGTAYGPTPGVRLVAATDDRAQLPHDTTWSLATSLATTAASMTQVYALYCWHDWIEHSDRPAKHELGWADDQTRQGRAMVRHWVLVMLAFTFSLLTGAPLPPPVTTALPATPARSPRSRSVWQEALRQVQSWLAPWARLHLYWQRWSTAPPPPERAALMDHVAHSHPLAAST